MPVTSDEADAQRWHKRFAVDCNNRAWELSVRARSPVEDREMLDAAHASAWHWTQIGTELNRMRAATLVAEVHALLGFGASAITFAEAARAYFVAWPETPDWELAVVHAVHAHAAHAAGETAAHRASYARAETAVKAIADEEDREIVLQTFRQVPPPPK